MPVERRRGRAHTSKAVLVAAAGVVVALGLAYGVAVLADRGDIEVSGLGDEVFDVGEVDELADDIEEREAPLGFGSLAGGARPIWVDRAPGDEDAFVAFGAFVPERPECTVNWKAERDVYVSDCDSDVTFPRSGEGLRTYPAEVVDGRLLVDLNADARSTAAGGG